MNKKVIIGGGIFYVSTVVGAYLYTKSKEKTKESFIDKVNPKNNYYFS